jgi:hypothetical protein
MKQTNLLSDFWLRGKDLDDQVGGQVYTAHTSAGARAMAPITSKMIRVDADADADQTIGMLIAVATTDGPCGLLLETRRWLSYLTTSDTLFQLSASLDIADRVARAQVDGTFATYVDRGRALIFDALKQAFGDHPALSYLGTLPTDHNRAVALFELAKQLLHSAEKQDQQDQQDQQDDQSGDGQSDSDQSGSGSGSDQSDEQGDSDGQSDSGDQSGDGQEQGDGTDATDGQSDGQGDSDGKQSDQTADGKQSDGTDQQGDGSDEQSGDQQGDGQEQKARKPADERASDASQAIAKITGISTDQTPARIGDLVGETDCLRRNDQPMVAGQGYGDYDALVADLQQMLMQAVPDTSDAWVPAPRGRIRDRDLWSVPFGWARESAREPLSAGLTGHVVILTDLSGSTSSHVQGLYGTLAIADASLATADALGRVLEGAGADVTLIAYGHGTYECKPGDPDWSRLDCGGNTPTAGALMIALEQSPDAVVLITDGEPTSSTDALQTALGLYHERAIPVMVLTIGRYTPAMAVQTYPGCHIGTATCLSDVQDVAGTISEMLATIG